ncbi:MAG: phosphotransferase [Phycisphaerales bacterium]|nr:phosphotransferase [Phycisphaerales bacterium]
MTEASGFDAVVRRCFPGATLRGVEALTGGVSAQVHRLDLDLPGGESTSVVLRIHGDDPNALTADREFALLRAVCDTGVPVPRPIDVDAGGDLIGRPWVLMPFVDGATELPDADRGIEAMADALASINRMGREALPTLPDRCDPLPEAIEFLPEGDEWLALRTWLAMQTGTTYDGTPALLHGDFWPGNLLWRDGAIVAILDWEDAAVGDPLSDVAGACLEIRYDHGVTGAQRFRDAYAAHAPIDDRRLAMWQVYVAAAAQRFMGRWGLEPDREANMRRVALESIREAASTLMS